jgi:prepilin-type N-terminal cleavage/methylation domain-containing protein
MTTAAKRGWAGTGWRERVRSLRNGAPGFTMIEVLVALALFGIVGGGLVANSVAAVRHNRVSHGLSAATALAQDQLEQLRALDPTTNPAALAAGTHADPDNPITALGGPWGTFTRQWTVTRDSPVAGASTVSVTVSWTDGVTRTVRLRAYVCQAAGCT